MMMQLTSGLRVGRVFRLALTLGLGLAAFGLPGRSAPGAAGPDLTGMVKGPADQPLTNASIFIYTAGPRLGAGLLCPSCDADCRKSAKSGPTGEFKIESLAPDLVFQVLIADGHQYPPGPDHFGPRP